MNERFKKELAEKLNGYVSGEITDHELQKWLDYGGASQLAQQLSRRERLYYSWMHQHLDEGLLKGSDQALKKEVAFFVRIMTGQVSWFERCRKWWTF